MKILLIDTNGNERTVEGRFRDIAMLIGAVYLDSVNLRDGRMMLVDDLGYKTEAVEHGAGDGFAFRTELKPVKARKPVNAKATALYHKVCVPGTTHQIVGDVAIVLDEDLS